MPEPSVDSSTCKRTARILCADDQPDVLEALRLLLKAEGFAVVTADSPAGTLAAAETGDLDVILMDLNYARDTTSGREGLDLLARLRELGEGQGPPVIVMTAWGSVEGAVEAMRRGARDYIQKPWDNARLLATLRAQLELSRALQKTRRLEGEVSRLRGEGQPFLIARSRAMQPVLRLLERVAPSDANVLILGAHGTGKEVVARWLHAHSRRAARPFLAVNAGGLADGVFESELFGHTRGAFTDAKTDRAGCFELAEGGTLFLDEIANMPLGQQAKLLRVLQVGEYHPVGSSRTRRADVRVLSATNVDVAAEVAAGRFREDLLYRFNTVELYLPALADRREDIPELAAHFLAQQASHYGRAIAGFSPGALEALLQHGWPGNIRELEHVIERAVLLCEAAYIDVEDLALRSRDSRTQLENLTLDQAESHLIQRALKRAGGNVSEAARALGLSRSAFYRRLQQHGIKG